MADRSAEPVNDAGHDVPSSRDGRTAPSRRRKPDLAQVFGDVLPDTTDDERQDSDGHAGRAEDSRDDDLLRDVPPHHG